MKRVAALVPLLALALPSVALAQGSEDENKGAFISDEWELHDWIPIHIGPIDMSINKAVAYLLLGALCSCLLGLVQVVRKVSGGQRVCGCPKATAGAELRRKRLDHIAGERSRLRRGVQRAAAIPGGAAGGR